ncbi:short-chain dehydrogenase/reductase SDR [Candidatus Thiomargarita nelsonii]|uniref:Short-chain dehydrogenase/reductase SDR n=1 Tax=Candidatus Thiomargarita nelsonii TaxID=1003181 RepID=A0A176S5W3_9GAMM|nr:short-chain dehydrogenase/reductase SDR [Candidatus Thiomargarita nelsonii]
MLLALYAAENPSIHFTALAPGLIDTAMQTYINQLEPLDIYPTLKRLQSARNTPDMPSPEAAAPSLAKAFKQVLSLPSGQYVDVRHL